MSRSNVPVSVALPWGQFSRQEPSPARRCPASPASSLANAPMSIQVAQEKLQAEIYARVNTCNMLLYQVRHRSRARDELQRRLRWLQAVEKQDKQHQEQLQVPRAPSWGGSTRGGPSSKPCTPRVGSRLGTRGHPVSPLPSLPQVVRQLENSIEKMLMKVHAGQKVTALYLEVRDVLRKVSSSSLCHPPTCSPCQGNKVSKGLLWWDALLHQPGPPAPLHPLSQCRGPLGLSGVRCCDSLCPRSWPTCLRTWTSCVGQPSCTMGSWKTWSSWLRMPSELLLQPR